MTSLADALAQLNFERRGWSRLGERWPQGPVTERATDPVAPQAYVPLVRELEAASSDDFTVPHRRLRRLHYSGHARWPEGARRGVWVDALISGDNADYPLTWSTPPSPTAETVDRLHGAAYLAPPPSLPLTAPVDLGGLFTATDGGLSGASELGLAAAFTTGVLSDGIAGWVGDLASWFLEWNNRRLAAERKGEEWKAEEQLTETQRQKVPLELMLGSFDGQVLADYYRTTLQQAVEPGNHHYGTVPAILDAAILPAETLEHYYADSMPEDHPHVTRRFALFVQRAVPPIPHTATGDQVSLGPDARETVRGYVSEVAAFFLYHGHRDKAFGAATSVSSRPLAKPSDIVGEVGSQQEFLETIATRFVELVQAGLGGEEPTWPRIT